MSSTARAARTQVLTGVWLALAEVATLSVVTPLGAEPLLWCGLATALLLTLGAFVPAVCCVLSMRRWPRVVGTPRLVPGALLVVLALALHVVNATQYVRLYAGIHLALGAVEVLVGYAGFWLLPPLPPGMLAGLRRTGATLALGGAGLLLGAVALVAVLKSPDLRFVAAEHTTFLTHLLLIDPVQEALPVAGAPVANQRQAEVSGVARGANLVVLTVDAMRADRMPGERHGLALPATKRLMHRGVRFSNAYAPSCWTVHSMSATLSSRLPSQLDFVRVGMNAQYQFTADDPGDAGGAPLDFRASTPAPFRDRTPTLAGMLAKAGYHTVTVVPYALYLRAAGITREFSVVSDADFKSHELDGMGAAPVPLTERATELVDARPKGKPFFLWLHYMDPHAPYDARDEAAQGGNDEARYDSEVRHVDREVGTLLDALNERDLLDNTLFVIHADHGEEFGDHGGRFHATSVYDEQVQVPLVIALPSEPGEARGKGATARGTSVDTPVSLVDLVPTVLDALGVRVESPLLGRSLVPALLGKPIESAPVLAECTRFGRSKQMVVDWPYKLVVDHSARTLALFNLEADPAEQRNLASEQRSRVEALLAQLPRIQ